MLINAYTALIFRPYWYVLPTVQYDKLLIITSGFSKQRLILMSHCSTPGGITQYRTTGNAYFVYVHHDVIDHST